MQTGTDRERVPAYYFRHPETRALLEVLAGASLEARRAFEDVKAQFFVDTATWALPLWENQAGIQPDPSLSEEIRRAALKRKMVANGNTTAEMVRDLAMTITGYRARVILNGDYSFSLEFLGEKTTLADIDVEEVRAIVERIKPAHLRFIISGLTWENVEGIGLIWQWFADNPTTWAEFEAKFCVHGESA